MQKVKVKGQRGHNPNLTVSGLELQFEFTYDDAYSLIILRWGVLLFFKVIRQI